MVSTNKLSVDWLRKRGWTADIIQRGGRVSRDFMGFADILAYCEFGPILVQAVGSGEMDSHLAKFTKNKETMDAMRIWQEIDRKWDGATAIHIHVWRKVRMKNKEGKKSKKDVWEPRIFRLTVEGDQLVTQEIFE